MGVFACSAQVGLADRVEINSRDNEPCESGRVAGRAVKKNAEGAL